MCTPKAIERAKEEIQINRTWLETIRAMDWEHDRDIAEELAAQETWCEAIEFMFHLLTEGDSDNVQV